MSSDIPVPPGEIPEGLAGVGYSGPLHPAFGFSTIAEIFNPDALSGRIERVDQPNRFSASVNTFANFPNWLAHHHLPGLVFDLRSSLVMGVL